MTHSNAASIRAKTQRPALRPEPADDQGGDTLSEAAIEADLQVIGIAIDDVVSGGL